MGHENLPASANVMDRYPVLKDIEQREAFPRHVFIIPDGNGRWANKVLNAPPILGHREGARKIVTLLRDMRQLPISVVTLWGFATSNWGRPEDEVKGLMRLFEDTINSNLEELMDNNSRFIHLGRKDRIPDRLKKTIDNAEQKTAENTGQVLCLAVDFGGKDQQIRMLQAAAEFGRNNPNAVITEEIADQLRDGHGLIPPADLIIRTSNEDRISDPGWLAENAEFYRESKLLPDIEIGDVVIALEDYSHRERRFGIRSNNTSK